VHLLLAAQSSAIPHSTEEKEHLAEKLFRSTGNISRTFENILEI
jgi:hypothetical protein